MQCLNCLGYRHDGACPPDDKESPPKLVTHFPKVCPFCGSDPGLARMSIVGDRIWYLVGCESDECACNPQVSGFTLADACDTGLPAGSADFVWGEDAWCYVVDKPKLIAEAARQLEAYLAFPAIADRPKAELRLEWLKARTGKTE